LTDKLCILGIAGSLRKGSYNKALLRAARERLPENATLEIYERLGEIPPYNDDVRRAGYPDVVQDLRDRIRAADALLIATPEYNHSVPGVLKNAIDWASRPPDQPLDGMPTALIGAATGAFGTLTAQLHLREICRSNNQLVVNGPAVLVMKARNGKFDEDGRLIDETGRRFLRELLQNLVQLTRCLRSEDCAGIP
jgi:chromate reductase